MSYLEAGGRVIHSRAYADWTAHSDEVASSLYLQGFELIQIPVPTRNSIDMKMTADVLTYMNENHGVRRFVLITGDFDFRPLVLSLRRAGRYVILMCSLPSTNRHLLKIVDEWVDVNQLGDRAYPFVSEDTEAPLDDPAKINILKKAAMGKLQEAVYLQKSAQHYADGAMIREVIRGLNPDFDEKELGYDSFDDFLEDAASQQFVILEETIDGRIVLPPLKDSQELYYEKLEWGFSLLSEIQRSLESSREAPIEARLLEDEILRKHPDFSPLRLGYRSFLTFLLASERRGIVILSKKSKGKMHVRSSSRQVRMMDEGSLMSKVRQVLKLGWVRSTRSGDRSFGETLESLMGVTDNNLFVHDLGIVEIRAFHKGRKTRITLATKTPSFEKRSDRRTLIQEFGLWDHETKTRRLMRSLGFRPSGADDWRLELSSTDDRINITHRGKIIAYQNLTSLIRAIEKNYHRTLLFIAETMSSDGSEYVRFVEAYLLADVHLSNLVKLIEENKIVFEWRLIQRSNGILHDHGTAYRIRLSDLPRLFRQARKETGSILETSPMDVESD